MKTDNEVLAEFLGVKVTPSGVTAYDQNKRKLTNVDDLEYDTSYDWLMPVWYKFKDLTFDTVRDNIDHSNHRVSIGTAILYGGIQNACKLLAQGIRWYNEIKK